MRKFTFWMTMVLIFLWTFLSQASSLFPRPIGHVSDFAGKMSIIRKINLEDVLGDQAKKGPEVAVAIVEQMHGLSVETYANQLFNKWGIGKNGKNNGVLLLVAVQERKIRIEVGDGLRESLNSSHCQFIIDMDISPALRRGDWDGGIEAGVQGILPFVNGGDVSDGVSRPPQKSSGWSWPFWITALIIALVVGLIFFDWANLSNKGLLEGMAEHAFGIAEPKKKRKLTPYEKKRKAEALIRKKAKAEKHRQEMKRRRLEAAKARKIAKRLHKAVRSKLKEMTKEDRKRAKKILRRWKTSPRKDRRWVSGHIPSMRQYVSYRPSQDGFTAMDFLFWHWVLFPNNGSSAGSDWGSHNYSDQSSYSSSDSGASFSDGGGSFGGGFSSSDSSSGASGGF